MSGKLSVHEAMVEAAAEALRSYPRPWQEMSPQQVADIAITAGNRYLESIGPQEFTIDEDELEGDDEDLPKVLDRLGDHAVVSGMLDGALLLELLAKEGYEVTASVRPERFGPDAD
jgi:hypothetical protein